MRCVILCFTLAICVAAPGAGKAATTSPAPPRCGDVLHFVGLTLTEARALAKRCHQTVGYVLEVPSSAPRGRVITQSLPYTGNKLVVSTGPLADPWGKLPGAAGPPVARECATTIHLSEDGNAGPLTCNGKHVNVEAWDFYAALRPRPTIMRLPRGLSTCQVVSHLVNRGLSTPENISAFTLANVYNGWHVPLGFVQHVFKVGPPNHDTC